MFRGRDHEESESPTSSPATSICKSVHATCDVLKVTLRIVRVLASNIPLLLDVIPPVDENGYPEGNVT